MIGEMNRRIIVKSWGSSSPDAGGGISAVQTGVYTIWAKVNARSGALYTGEEQALWNYDYEVTTRYEKSRIVKSNQTIDYDGKRLAINSVSFSEEGNRKFVTCRCSTTDGFIDTSGDVHGPATPTPGIRTLDYSGIGGEDSFIATELLNGDPYPLIGKTIIGAFKDGIEFSVQLSGVPDPAKKEVVYNSTTGAFTWSIPFEPGEHTLIQYLT